jgi:hypothetical protein
MTIPAHFDNEIRALDVDEHRTACSYAHWESEFPAGTYLAHRLAAVKAVLGSSCTRSEVLALYRRSDIDPETKFIAAMLWGHEAPSGSRRDGRGPWKVSKMFSDAASSEAAIRSVRVDNPAEITRSYKLLDKTLNRCGPNFFTKHFYFMGKAQGLAAYPLIFDDRVANGLVKIALRSNSSKLALVRVSAARSPKAYLDYLTFAHDEAKRIGCEPDQIEYFLFNQ